MVEELLIIACSALLGAISGAIMLSRLSRNTKTSIKDWRYLGDSFNSAKSELQSLQFEKTLVAEAITRVYEAQQEGKIDRVERDRLLLKYKHQVASYSDKIAALEPVVDFTELSEVRNNIVGLMERRITMIDQKLAELCNKFGISSTDISESIRIHQGPILQKNTQKAENKTQVSPLEEVLIGNKKKSGPYEREQPEGQGSKSEEKTTDGLQKDIMEALSRLEKIKIDNDDKLPKSEDMTDFAHSKDKSCLRQFS